MESELYESLMRAAYRFVSYRPRSEKEFREYLTKKLTSWHASGNLLIEKVIARMGELGYVDDEKFASWWLSQRSTFKPKGNRVIEMELKRHGVAPSIIEQTMASRGSDDLLEGAKTVIRRKVGLWRRLPPHELQKKVYDYLARRGYDNHTIGRIVDWVEEKE